MNIEEISNILTEEEIKEILNKPLEEIIKSVDQWIVKKYIINYNITTTD